MKKHVAIAACALSVGLLFTACSSSKKSDSSSTTTAAKASASSTTAAASGSTLPTIAGITKTGTKSLSDGGTMTSYTTSAAGNSIAGSYETAVKAAGWSVTSSGGGGGRWGGSGLSATKGSEYLVVSAGGGGGTTYVDVCTWPSKPKNDDCGSNDNQDNQNSNQQNN
jgi:hypothetical protein